MCNVNNSGVVKIFPDVENKQNLDSHQTSTCQNAPLCTALLVCKELMGSLKKPDPFLVLLLHSFIYMSVWASVCLSVRGQAAAARTDCMIGGNKGDHYKLVPQSADQKAIISFHETLFTLVRYMSRYVGVGMYWLR